MKRLIVLVGFACLLANGNPTDPGRGKLIVGWTCPLVQDAEERPPWNRIDWGHPNCLRVPAITFRVERAGILETATSLDGPWEHVEEGYQIKDSYIPYRQYIEINIKEPMRFFRIRKID